jgi:tRNA1Val (adenine37-N6)-methyltransferase
VNSEGDETIDELRRYGLQIIQPRHGYRFSVDPLLLCDFAGVTAGERLVDLGTGCGIMPLVLARQGEDVRAVGVEFQEQMAALALRNVRENGLAARIDILAEDITALKRFFPVSSFDLVIANPPYRRRGTGRVSPKAGRDDARHESTASLADFLMMAKYLVKPAGRICFIYHPSRLAELLVEAAALKLAPLRLRMVHGNGAADARIFLVELAKGRKGELKVLPPLFMYDVAGGYSAEMRGIYGETAAG